MRLSATELLEGCENTTLPSALMLNDDQLSVALLLVWLMVRFFPVCTAVAVPEDTKALFVAQAPGAQGTGNCVPEKAMLLGPTAHNSATP